MTILRASALILLMAVGCSLCAPFDPLRLDDYDYDPKTDLTPTDPMKENVTLIESPVEFDVTEEYPNYLELEEEFAKYGPTELMERFAEWKEEISFKNLLWAGRIGPEMNVTILRMCDLFRNRSEDISVREKGTYPYLQIHHVKLVSRQCEELKKGFVLNGHLLAPVNVLDNILISGANVINGRSWETREDSLRAAFKLEKSIRGIKELLEEGAREGVTFYKKSLEAGKVIPTFDLLWRLLGGINLKLVPAARELDDYVSDCYRINQVSVEFNGKYMWKYYQKDENHLCYYENHTRKAAGVWSIKEGAGSGTKFYQACIDLHTQLKDRTPELLRTRASTDLDDLTKKFLEVSAFAGYPNMTVRQVFEALNKDPSQRVRKEDVEGYMREIGKKTYPMLKKIMPSWMFDWVFEHTAGDEENIVANYTSVKNPEAAKKYQLLSIALLESFPGQHFLDSVAKKLKPRFVRMGGFGSRATAPAAMSRYPSFVLGWELYSEELGRKKGLFEDDKDLLGYYHWMMLAAARVVVDTDIHYFDKDREKQRERAIEYIKKHTWLNQTEIEVEVDRSIAWPGWAVAGYAGYLEIRDLRREKKRKMGDDFDEKEFHAKLMYCMGPLDKLKDCMEELQLLEDLYMTSEHFWEHSTSETDQDQIDLETTEKPSWWPDCRVADFKGFRREIAVDLCTWWNKQYNITVEPDTVVQPHLFFQ